MMYLIENEGEVNVDNLWVLGLSTARGDSKSIGQFGSGAKHALLTLLRAGIKFSIWSGLRRYTAEFEQREGFRLMVIRHGEERFPTSMSDGFGALDWTNPDFAMRELISNAIDQSGWKMPTREADEVGVEGRTRVYVDCDPRLQAYMMNLCNYFLHPHGMERCLLVPKPGPGPLRLFRRGVLIETLPDVSVVDYNFDFAVNESRTTVWKIYIPLAQAIKACSNEVFKSWFRLFITAVKANNLWVDKIFESCLDPYWLGSQTEARIKIMETVWLEVMGQTKVTCRELASQITEPAIVVSDGLYNILPPSLVCLLPDFRSSVVLHKTSNLGDMTTCIEIWGRLVSLGLTCDRPRPQIKVYTNHDGSAVFGFVEDDVVHIHLDHIHDLQTILEEFAHYVSGHKDFTRPFQEVLTSWMAAFYRNNQ